MAKLKTLRSSLQCVPSTLKAAPTPSDQRITGRRLQDRRHRLWTAAPHCARCGRLTDWPHGFELDHIVALTNGGADIDENCQVLCVWTANGIKTGCHIAKTSEDLGQRVKVQTGLDGWPENRDRKAS